MANVAMPNPIPPNALVGARFIAPSGLNNLRKAVISQPSTFNFQLSTPNRHSTYAH